ncbi:PaeR7I family type II restriction endonuclease [Streptomyces sp. S.PNR 29]|uniref:PaeR7I family type II restriction endonuclease n=1 Tax=Streptomyces sp. S.PNR 29 TaxID=2973805 RepID=UPI0025B21303|nr:PaeR7I family type II restriction endonuclease [Streptomyces sp. S.PNR 29]MDN0199434.1 PaeR7I family type II restriction endonuclease [Streptomyces sp. S.PNR 29]
MSAAARWTEELLTRAVQEMWTARAVSTRSGKHMQAIESLIINHVRETTGSLPLSILQGDKATIPGFFRPRKNWDIIGVHGERLVFAIEVKSQDAKKLGNNANNRNEEAVGSATDLRQVYANGILGQGDDWFPWLGYIFILEDDERRAATRDAAHKVEAAFPLDPIYGERPSYARRYHVLCERLLETGLYDGVSFMICPPSTDGRITHPDEGTGIRFSDFMQSLDDRLRAYQKLVS